MAKTVTALPTSPSWTSVALGTSPSWTSVALDDDTTWLLIGAWEAADTDDWEDKTHTWEDSI